MPPNPLTPPQPLLPDPESLFQLDPAWIFLNHGSFGAVMREVAAAQEEWRRTLEARPIERIGRRIQELLAVSKQALGRLVGYGFTRLAMPFNRFLHAVIDRRGL